MGGEIITPIFDSFNIFSRLIGEKGVSLGAKSRVFPLFNCNRCNLVTKLSGMATKIF